MKLKFFLAVFILSCAAVCTVGAEGGIGDVVIEYDRQSGRVTQISGSISSGGGVALTVLKPGTDIDRLNSGEIKFKDCGIYADETTAENGRFTFPTFKIKSDVPADFDVRISDGSSLYEGKIYYASVSDTLALISDRTTGTEVKECIEKYNDSYGLDTDGIFSGLTDANKELVYSGMCGKRYTQVQEVRSEFNIRTVLAKINQGPWGELESIITTANSELKLNLAAFSAASSTERDTVIKKICGRVFSGTSDLQAALDTALSSLRQSSAGSGSSGGSSSGSGSSVVMPSLTPAAEPEVGTVFDDLSGALWAKEAIDELCKRGIVSGRGDGTFAPNDSITRSEAVKMTVCAYRLADSEGCAFMDVAADNWAYKYICAASGAGIISGIGEGIFGGDRPVTREEFAAILYRTLTVLGKTEPTSGKSDFSDRADIADYAKQSVDYMQQRGIISGENGKFVPKRNISRAEVSVILWNCLK